MFKLSDSRPWLLLALSTGVVSALHLATGSMPLPALIVCVVAGGCAIHRPTREAVTDGLLRLFSGSTVRSLVVIFGAMMLIQLLPLELALLMAGDILVYLEAVAAVSLIAANTRLKPLVGALRARLQIVASRARGRLRRPARQTRSRRPPRRPSRSEDPDGLGWACA